MAIHQIESDITWLSCCHLKTRMKAHLFIKEPHNTVLHAQLDLREFPLAPSVHMHDYLFPALSWLYQLCLTLPIISVVTCLLWCHLYNSVLMVSMCKSCLLHITICHWLFPEPFTDLLSPFSLQAILVWQPCMFEILAAEPEIKCVALLVRQSFSESHEKLLWAQPSYLNQLVYRMGLPLFKSQVTYKKLLLCKHSVLIRYSTVFNTVTVVHTVYVFFTYLAYSSSRCRISVSQTL